MTFSGHGGRSGATFLRHALQIGAELLLIKYACRDLEVHERLRRVRGWSCRRICATEQSGVSEFGRVSTGLHIPYLEDYVCGHIKHTVKSPFVTVFLGFTAFIAASFDSFSGRPRSGVLHISRFPSCSTLHSPWRHVSRNKV